MRLDSDICNFADENTIYSCGIHLHEIVTNLESDLSRLLEWFTNNGMVANRKKILLTFLGLKGQRRLQLNINDNTLSETDHVKLLGIEVGNKLKFSKHVKALCSKVTKKISAFSWLNTHISREQILTSCNAVILSNFNYCPLIWLFCNKGANKEIGRTHKRALRILYKEYGCPLEILLTRSGSFCIHVKNLQKLMTEMYKSMNQLNPSLIWEFHEKKHVTYDLRMQNLCKLPKIKTQGYGQESLSFRGSFLWNTLDDTIRISQSLRLTKRGSKTGLVINAPVKYAANYSFFCIKCIFLVNS